MVILRKEPRCKMTLSGVHFFFDGAPCYCGKEDDGNPLDIREKWQDEFSGLFD